MKDTFKKIIKSFYSMKFGIGLLIIIGLVSIIGTLIPQGNSPDFYLQNYSNFWSGIILAFDFDKVYSSWWYILLSLMLLINLFLCSVNRFRPIFKKSFKAPDPRAYLKNEDKFIKVSKTPEEILKKLRIKDYKKEEIDSKEVYWSFGGKIGHLGSWLTHLSIIVIMLAFAYGRYKGFDEFAHGVPGTVMDLENSDYKIRVDQYDILFRKDYTVEQYITTLSILDKDGKKVDEGVTMVNHPFRFEDFNIYQNSTGWAYDAMLFKDEKLYEEKLMYKGDFFVADDEKIALQFVDFYPDFDPTDPTRPRTKSPFLKHPIALYAIFYNGQRVDMGLSHLNEPIEWEEYAFVIKSPQMFTLVQVANDPATPIALVGAVMLMVGLYLAFYINPRHVIVIKEDGESLLRIGYVKNDKLSKRKLEKTIKELRDDRLT